MQFNIFFLITGLLTSQVLTQSNINILKRDGNVQCPALTISSTEGVNVYSNCEGVNGGVTITANDEDETIIDWQDLKEVKGNFTISGGNVTEIYLPSLKKVKGIFTIENLSNLKILSISALGSVDTLVLENISLESEIVFSGVSVNKLLNIKNTSFQSIQGIRVMNFVFDIEISNNSKLKYIGLRFTKNQISNLIVKDNPLLEVLDIPFIQRIEGDLIVKNNKALNYFRINHLVTVANRVEIISPKLVTFQYGSFVMRKDDIIEAPVDCDEFKTVHQDFNVDKCRQLARENGVLSTTYSKLILLVSIAIVSFLL